jgi:hypothetical protein
VCHYTDFNWFKLIAISLCIIIPIDISLSFIKLFGVMLSYVVLIAIMMIIILLIVNGLSFSMLTFILLSLNCIFMFWPLSDLTRQTKVDCLGP